MVSLKSQEALLSDGHATMALICDFALPDVVIL